MIALTPDPPPSDPRVQARMDSLSRRIRDLLDQATDEAHTLAYRDQCAARIPTLQQQLHDLRMQAKRAANRTPDQREPSRETDANSHPTSQATQPANRTTQPRCEPH